MEIAQGLVLILLVIVAILFPDKILHLLGCIIATIVVSIVLVYRFLRKLW